MADEEKPPTEEKQPEFVENWSPISQGDLGLKAIYGNLVDGFKFRDIVGWITWNARPVGEAEARSKNDFAPIVIADNYWPMLAKSVPGYLGVIPKGMTEEEVRRRLQENAGGSVNVRGVGQA